jgi:hypothetical protein
MSNGGKGSIRLSIKPSELGAITPRMWRKYDFLPAAGARLLIVEGPEIIDDLAVVG